MSKACQKIKSSGKPNQAEVKLFNSSRLINQITATVYVGPFKATVPGNKQLMIINYFFSKY